MEYLKDKGIEWAVELADFALMQLTEFLWNKFEVSTDEKRKEIFKNKILEKFPDSALAGKLKGTSVVV